MNIHNGRGQQLHLEARKHSRSDVKIMAGIRVSGGIRGKVRIIDLSRSGFQMECLSYIPADRPVFLTIPGLAQLECDIAWRSEWHYGCVFTPPLHDAVYDQIVMTDPACVTDCSLSAF